VVCFGQTARVDSGYVRYSQYVRYAYITVGLPNSGSFQSNLRVLRTSRGSRVVRACHARIIVDFDRFAHILCFGMETSPTARTKYISKSNNNVLQLTAASRSNSIQKVICT
jgi:hypothetical protein